MTSEASTTDAPPATAVPPASTQPVATPAVTPQTATPSPTPTNTRTTVSVVCEDRAVFSGDVSIRDGTVLTPGEAFVKIWRLQNDGTCPWTQDYALTFFGGERMGAPETIPLGSIVPPGEMTDLAVDFVAPDEAGAYQGFWRLTGTGGRLFGIGPNGDQSFWVSIVVEVPQVTLTPTIAPTATLAAIAQGILDLPPGSTADLDSGAANPAQGADLLFEESAPGAGRIVPLEGAMLEAGPLTPIPGPDTCTAASLTAEPVPLDALSLGDSLCYRTAEGRPGVLIINVVNGTLGLSFTTWSP
jgi:hypothetical protein